MKHLFDCKRKLSAFLALGFLLLPVLAYSSEESLLETSSTVIETNKDYCLRDEIRECRAMGRKSIMIRPEVLSSIDLTCVLRAVIEDALANNEVPSQAVVACYESITQGEGTVCAQDLLEAIPVIVEKMASVVDGRAPRPDGSPGVVGPLLVCDFNQVLAELNNLSQQLAECCNEIINEINELNLTFSSCEALITTITTCCSGVIATVTTCCADIIDTVTICCNTTFTLLNSINTTLTTCCEDINDNFVGTFTVLNSINNTVTTCCNDIDVNFVGTFTSLTALQTSVDTCCTTLNANIGAQSDNPPLFDSLPSSTDTYITTTFNVIEWLKAIYVRLGQHAGY